MISNVELQHVQKTAKDVPYPGDDYALSVIEKLAEANEIFKKKYDKKKYDLILSNGEEIEFEVKDKNLAHILGIEFKALIADGRIEHLRDLLGFEPEDRMNSYDILQRIIDNAGKVIKNDKTLSNEKKILNYYKLMIKCSCFSKLSDFEDFNFGVLNFDKTIFLNNSNYNFYPNSTKFLFTESDEALIPFCMMGLVQDSFSYSLVPETLLAPTNFQEFVRDQELVLPVQILKSDENELSKYIAKASDKTRLLDLYKTIISQYKITTYINVFNDYETTLRQESIRERTKALTPKNPR